MKQLRRERIFFGQSTHTCPNFCCCFCFQQEPCLVWRRSFKPFLKTSHLTFPSQNLVLDLVSSKKKTFLVLGFYLILIHSYFYHASYGKTPPKPLLPLWNNPNILSKLIKSIFGFIPIISFPTIIMSFLLSLGDLQSKYLNTFDLWSQFNSSGWSLVPTT